MPIWSLLVHFLSLKQVDTLPPPRGCGGESFLFASKGNCQVLGLNFIKFKKTKKMRMTSVTSVTEYLFL